MGAFKATVREMLGPGPRAERVLDTAYRIRRPWSDPLLEPPVPWLAPGVPLLVIWSAKSACSLTFVWYLSLVGQLDQFRASGESPHEYRGRRYMSSDAFKRGKRRVLDDYRVVHVIRDPYLRAVSSFRHALATGFADRRSAMLDRRLDRQEGVSFSRYLDFLEELDPNRWNVHFRQQFHRIERIKPADYVINISKVTLLDELNNLEEELGLPRTDFAALGSILQKEEERRAKTTPFVGDVANRPLDVPAARASSRGRTTLSS
jgi:hypothetical protein